MQHTGIVTPLTTDIVGAGADPPTLVDRLLGLDDDTTSDRDQGAGRDGMEQRLIDAIEKVEIQEVESRYEWAVDEGRLDVLGSLFTADAYLTLQPRGIERNGRGEIVEWFREYCEDWGWRNRRHYVSNFDIRVQGESARVRFYYFLTYETEGRSCVAWGRYDDTLVRRGDAWLIATKLIRSAAPRVIYLDEGWAGLEQMPVSSEEWQGPRGT